MAFGFVQPFQSRLGPVGQRAMASMPAPAVVQMPNYASAAAAPAFVGMGSPFPQLPKTAQPAPAPAPQAEKPAETAPATPPAAPQTPGMPTTPPAEATPSEADMHGISDLIAAIFGG